MTKHFFAWIMIAFVLVIALNFQIMAIKDDTNRHACAIGALYASYARVDTLEKVWLEK